MKYFDNLLRVFLVSWTAVVSILVGMTTVWLMGVVFFMLVAPVVLIAYEQR